MTTPFYSLEQLDSIFNIEHDWLFEKLLNNLNAHRHIILSADQSWGIKEYVSELGFQLTEKYPDIQICYMDIAPAKSPDAFIELFKAALTHKFPDVISRIELKSPDPLKLPSLIAKSKKIRVAVFLANTHMFHRFRNSPSFLRSLNLKLRYQKNCVFCLYGNDNPHFKDLVHYPGPLSGLGQLIELRHNPWKHRSAGIRKLFHDQGKNIGQNTSEQMSYMVNNHPFYLKLLAWHSMIRTRQTCTLDIVKKAMNDLILHYDHGFTLIAEDLTSKQLSFLEALLDDNQRLYSKDTRDQYQLGSSSNIARIKNSLESKGIISSFRRDYFFNDPIFKIWLRSYYLSRL